jgi:hypothetical protein
MPHLYRYRFSNRVATEEVEGALLLAVLALESLHGAAQVRLDADHAFDAVSRTCVVDGSTSVGRDLNRLFYGFVVREFGEDNVAVERIEKAPQAEERAGAS